ncbi:hypothetical protein [[Scytonema hofmanni] UTEX B 1581]|uniref:hypothetical protein n=1 Tax=[Scytonema hofmanni] UTEX B 1581 TaxID=379535 RepID=UPI001C8F7900|nr:hypothetical protein [[Scytonema hofmanni] UTEX B 1581]
MVIFSYRFLPDTAYYFQSFSAVNLKLAIAIKAIHFLDVPTPVGVIYQKNEPPLLPKPQLYAM